MDKIVMVNGDPFNGILGTVVTADLINALQQEIVAPIIAAGLTPDTDDNQQLLAAIIELKSTATTQPAGDATIKVATDEFVQRELKSATDLLGAAISGLVVIDISGAAEIVLNAAQSGVGIIVFTGALTRHCNIIVPSKAARRAIFNRTSGSFIVTVKTAAGPGIAIRRNLTYETICDGVDVFPIAGGGAGSKARQFFMTTA